MLNVVAINGSMGVSVCNVPHICPPQAGVHILIHYQPLLPPPAYVSVCHCPPSLPHWSVGPSGCHGDLFVVVVAVAAVGVRGFEGAGSALSSGRGSPPPPRALAAPAPAAPRLHQSEARTGAPGATGGGASLRNGRRHKKSGEIRITTSSIQLEQHIIRIVASFIG